MVHNYNLRIKTVIAIIVIAMAACGGSGSGNSDTGNGSSNMTKEKHEKIIASGYSDDLEWKIVGTTLIISGKGKMKAYALVDRPWYNYSNDITTLIIEDGVENITERVFERFPKLTSVTIPNTVEFIGRRAFACCEKLKSITIPSSVKIIREEAFIGCTNLTSINVDENNTEYSAEDGVLFNKTKTTLICYPLSKINATYSIPNTVTKIEQFAFAGNENLKSVIIPSSVEIIGENAFNTCGLTEVTNYAISPQHSYGSIFERTPIEQARLRVPADSKEAYKSATEWRRFAGIVAIDE